MTIEVLLYDSIFIVIETAMLILFIRNSLTSRIRTIWILLILASAQILRRVLLGEIGLPAFPLTIAIDLVFINVCFSGTIKKIIFLVIIFYALGALLDVAAALTIILLNNRFRSAVTVDDIAFAATVLSKLMLLPTIMLTRKTLKSESGLNNWIILLPGLVLIIIAVICGSPFTDYESGDQINLMSIICVFGLVTVVYSVIIIQRSNEIAKNKYKLNLMEEHSKTSADHFHEIQAAYRLIEHTAHDIQHHFNYVEAAPDLDSAIEYVRTLKDRSFERLKKLRTTGNYDIDIVLYSKQFEMREKGIDFTVKDILPPSIEWLKPVDVMIILGNALSNAIESCEKCEDKKITVSFQFSSDWLIISIENTINEPPRTKAGGVGFVSAKQTPSHGIVIESMAASVVRYEGTMNYSVSVSSIRLDILLQSSLKNNKG